jgi:hypothetical protein
MNNIFYVYIYLNPLKPGEFNFNSDLSFLYEPFYVGKGHSDRCEYGIKYVNLINNLHKKNTINKILINNKYPIIIKVYEKLDEKKAFELESLVINEIGRRDMKLGPLVNLTDGGEGRKDRSKERIELMSKPVMQFKDNILICEFNSIKEAISSTGIINIGNAASGKYKTSGGYVWKYKDEKDILQGHLKEKFSRKKQTEETKNKLRVKRSDETKIKLSLSQQNKKSVYQYDINKNLIKEWVSTGSIERELGFYRACIRKCCNGDIKKSYGYFWSWKLL